MGAVPRSGRRAFVAPALAGLVLAGVLLVMNGDGSGLTDLTNSPGDDGVPAWSAGGTKIAFEANGPGQDYDIFVINADGSGQTDLTNSPATSDGGPTWSPDGTKIAFD